MTENDTLTRKQIKGIAALLAHQTVTEAAKDAGVSEKTLYRWMQDETFSAELRAAATKTIDGMVRRLTAGRDVALDTIYNLILYAKSDNVQRLAAKDWFEILHRTIELDEIEKRLTVLEEKIK